MVILILHAPQACCALTEMVMGMENKAEEHENKEEWDIGIILPALSRVLRVGLVGMVGREMKEDN